MAAPAVVVEALPASAAEATPVAPGAVDAPVVWSALRPSALASVLSTPVVPGAVTPVLADAADADTSFSEVASSAVAVVAAEDAAIPAGFGHRPGAGSTPAGRSLHHRHRYLLSRRSNPHRQRSLLRKVMGISSPHELNSVRHRSLSQVLPNSSGSFATFVAIRRASSFVSSLAADRRGSSSK